MGSECWHCRRPIFDYEDVAQDRWGVNLEIHVDCLRQLRDGLEDARAAGEHGGGDS